MCDYCGCRQVEPIAELMDEHAAIREVAGDVLRALASDRSAVVERLACLRTLLRPHVEREERGIFAALKDEGEYAGAVAELEGEHAGFEARLDALDPSAPGFGSAVRALLAELSEHIDKEDLGIFPVSVVTLGADGWNTVSRAHQRYASPLASYGTGR